MTFRVWTLVAFPGLALLATVSFGGASASNGVAKFATPVTWGSPDQPYGAKEMIFEIDGHLVAAVVTNNVVKSLTEVAFSNALIYAGVRGRRCSAFASRCDARL
jgi:hypothetical protein